MKDAFTEELNDFEPSSIKHKFFRGEFWCGHTLQTAKEIIIRMRDKSSHDFYTVISFPIDTPYEEVLEAARNCMRLRMDNGR